MRKCILLLLGSFFFVGCSRDEAHVDAIGDRPQELINSVEQTYRACSNRLFMARFENEILAMPERSDQVQCVRQYLQMVRSEVRMIKDPKHCILWANDVFNLVGHAAKMMNLVGYPKDEQAELVFSVMDIVHDQIAHLQSLCPVGSRIEQSERPHDIKSLKSYMSSWDYWVRRFYINQGFNEDERSRYLSRLNELMKITR